MDKSISLQNWYENINTYAVVNGMQHPPPRGIWGFKGEMRGTSYWFPGAVASYSQENAEDFQGTYFCGRGIRTDVLSEKEKYGYFGN